MHLKKSILIILTLSFSMAIFHIACTKDHEAEEKPLDMTDYTDKLTDLDWAGIESDRLYIIRSANEYKQYMKNESDPLPGIDFKKFSLLVVKGQVNKGISEITKQITLSETGDYRVKIGIVLNDALLIQDWHIGLLTPAIPQDKKIELQIEPQSH